MHELSLVGSMLEIVEEYAARHNFSRVNSLRISFGSLSCIDASALQMAFNVLAQDTRAGNAKLTFIVHPIVINCLACDADSEVDSYPAPCPKCDSEDVNLVGGFEDMRLEELDVD